MNADRSISRPPCGGITIAVVLIAVGALLLMRNFDVIRLPGISELWPLVLIAIGLEQLFRQPRSAGS
jgi:hypothetical protein